MVCFHFLLWLSVDFFSQFRIGLQNFWNRVLHRDFLLSERVLAFSMTSSSASFLRFQAQVYLRGLARQTERTAFSTNADMSPNESFPAALLSFAFSQGLWTLWFFLQASAFVFFSGSVSFLPTISWLLLIQFRSFFFHFWISFRVV